MGACSGRGSTVDFDGPGNGVTDVDLRHFTILRSIGKGSYGKVCIVRKKDTKQLYAMKYMSKARMIRKETVYNVLREQDMLIKINHSNIVKLWFTFQDEEDVFMVVDLLLGGDLGYHIEKYGRLSFDRVKLYVAEVGMALDYLKTKSIIHRDIKPANLLLNSSGHVFLSDFNVACYIKPGIPVTSVTGTKPYMAPEMLAPPPEGYSHAVDWWGLGVTAYQLLRAQLPFRISCSEDHGVIAEHICHRRNLHVSSTWDDNIRILLHSLIQPDISRRITSVENLKTLSVFDGEDWDAIILQTFTPPFVPPKNRIMCDPTYELEEMIIEPNPLHKKERRLQRRRSKNANVPEDAANDISHLFMPYNRIRSLDTTGRALSVEKEVLEGQRRAASNNAKHKVSVSASTCSSEGNKSYNESITTQPSSNWQKKRSSDATVPVKQRVSDSESSEDEPLATGVTTVQLEHTV